MRKTQILLSLLLFLLMTTFAWGVSSYTGKWQSGNTALIFDTDVTIDANALEMFIYNDGNFAYDNANVFGKTDGLYFPRGTKKTVIYAGGIWLGGKVDGGIRVAIAEFSSEFVPGNMENGTFVPDNASFKVFKIKRGDDAASNPDYANWPADMGAPVNDDGTPAMLGDVMTWSVYNEADVSKHTNMATDPLGLEVQHTAFAYARGGALGQVIFQKFKIINNGTNTIDSTYVSLWADPDLGDASDDLVGCDTVLSLGYCYNEGADGIYGAAPPAVGYDFFQGPIVPGEATDSAYVSGEYISGFKNLPMTSFNKYINGTDPAEAEHVWRYMKGLQRDVDSLPVDNNGDTTRFVHAGDPVTGEGWIDEASADRRWMMSSGPFTMEPGDEQEVVTAVLVGQGSNPLTSISALKAVDVAAQAVFDLNFDIPSPPPAPIVWVRGGDGFIDLAWGQEPVGSVEENAALGQEFHFEGFNLWQGESSVGPWTKFATYDRGDDESWICDSTYDEEHAEWEFTYCTADKIYGDVVDPVAGGAQRVILQAGSDSGLEFHVLLDRDQIGGGPLLPNRPYYLAVTAYSYDWNNITEFTDLGGNRLGIISEVLESPITAYEVRPMTHVGVFSDTAAHAAGGSDGSVIIEYVDYDEITGHDYEVTFNSDDTWNVQDKTTGVFVLEDQVGQAPGFAFPIIDGVMVRAQGPSLGVKSVSEVATAAGAIDPDNVNYSRNSTSDWYLDPGGNHSFSRYSWQGATTNDYEIRFVEGDTEGCFDWFGQGDYGQVALFKVPIEFWDIGIGTVDDPSDDRRIAFAIIDDDGSNSFTYGDGLYIWDIDYDDINWSDPLDHAGNYDPDYAGLHFGRWWFYDLSGETDRPAAGTVIRTITNKVNTEADIFSFTTKKVGDGDGTFIANSLDEIKTVPNPYYAFFPEELDQFDRIVKFINLPATPMTIRIFNIAGDLVRTMERDDVNDPEFIWDLKTDSGLWVAPGVYVWLIEAEGLGSKFGKMAIFTEVEQLNTF